MVKSYISALAALTVTQAFAQESALPPDFARSLAESMAKSYQPSSGDLTQDKMLSAFELEIASEETELQAGATEASQSVETLQSGTKMKVLSQSEGWFAVEAPDGKFGWVNAKDATLLPWPGTSGSDMKAAGLDYDMASWAQDWMADQIEQLLIKAGEMREQYKNNPYVSIDGFSVSISVPPSLDVAFSFK